MSRSYTDEEVLEVRDRIVSFIAGFGFREIESTRAAIDVVRLKQNLEIGNHPFDKEAELIGKLLSEPLVDIKYQPEASEYLLGS